MKCTGGFDRQRYRRRSSDWWQYVSSRTMGLGGFWNRTRTCAERSAGCGNPHKAQALHRVVEAPGYLFHPIAEEHFT